MDHELQHPLANLLAKTAEEWFRFYGTEEAQAAEMHAVIDLVFADRMTGGEA